MSVKVMAAAWDLTLEPMDKLVLLAMADFASDEGLAWPSIATLVRKSGASERTVQRSIRRLQEMGNLTLLETTAKGNKYRVHPRHSDTPVTVTPPSHRHPTPVTVTPPPRHSDTQTIIEPSRTVIDKRGTRIPSDWRPTKPTGQALKIWDAWDIDRKRSEAESFVDYWRTVPGGKALKLDWDAAWRTWIRNADKFHPAPRQEVQIC